MRDKRDMIRLHVKNGVTNLGSIRESYNTYSQGGNLYRGTTNKSNQMEFSFAPDKYSTIPQAQLAPTVKQRQAIERNKFLQTNPTFQQPISKPTGSEKAGQFMHDVGSKMLNAITTFGGSAIGDVINDISPEAANTVSKYTLGMIQPTSQEYLESNRSGQWGNRLNNSANAISSQMIGEVVGAGVNKIPAALNIGKNVVSNNIKRFSDVRRVNSFNNDLAGGIYRGGSEFIKGSDRKFSEIFPITKAQQKAVIESQNAAHKEGVDFVEN